MPTDPKPLTMSAEREAKIRREWSPDPTHREMFAELDATRAALAETQEQLENVDRMLRKSRIYCHIPPDEKACRDNAAIEPEGERLRNELADWLERNGIVGVLMDTPNHYIDIGIAKLPPRIKTVLRQWGAISVVDEADSGALRAKPVAVSMESDELRSQAAKTIDP